MIRYKGIPYDIIGNGIMISDAKDIRCIKYQSDNCNKWFKENKIDMNNQKQYAIDVLQQAIKICEDYSIDRYSLYKGRSPYKGNEDGRADNYVNGQSDGAEYCVAMLEELLESVKNEQAD